MILLSRCYLQPRYRCCRRDGVVVQRRLPGRCHCVLLTPVRLSTLIGAVGVRCVRKERTGLPAVKNYVENMSSMLCCAVVSKPINFLLNFPNYSPATWLGARTVRASHGGRGSCCRPFSRFTPVAGLKTLPPRGRLFSALSGYPWQCQQWAATIIPSTTRRNAMRATVSKVFAFAGQRSRVPFARHTPRNRHNNYRYHWKRRPKFRTVVLIFELANRFGSPLGFRQGSRFCLSIFHALFKCLPNDLNPITLITTSTERISLIPWYR